MKSIVCKCIPFANRLLGFALTKFDQIVTCVNQVTQIDFDSNTCMIVPWGIISKDVCITSAIVDTQIWNVVYIKISVLAFALTKFDQIEIGVNQVPYYAFFSETWILTSSGIQ